MENAEHLAILKQGVEAWNQWRKENSGIRPNLIRADLEGADLSLADLSRADLSNANLMHADLRAANLNRADLRRADLTYANLILAYLSIADLSGACLIRADLRGADLSGANLSSADLSSADLSRADLEGADLNSAELTNASLSGADLTSADLRGAKLTNADLRKARLILAQLTNSNWGFVSIDASTQLEALDYTPEHEALRDNSERLRILGLLKYVQWSSIRNIGQFPLFGISWFGLAVSLLVLNYLGWWNSNLGQPISLPVLSGRLVMAVPIPDRLVLTAISALFLAFGTTLYKLFCPIRVQHFSEVEWVEVQKHARLLYLSHSFRYPFLRYVTLFFFTTGGLLGLYLLGWSILSATRYSWPIIMEWFPF